MQESAKDVFEPIDLAFARMFSQKEENSMLFSALLMAASRLGHVSIKKNQISHILQQLNCPLDLKNKWEKSLASFEPTPSFPIVKEDDRYYLERNFFFESRIALHLKRLLSMNHALKGEIEIEGLTDEQKEAVKRSLHYSLMLLSGGPGTGKTYTAVSIIKAFQSFIPKLRVIVSAPTGKAVAHLENKIRSQLDISAILLEAGTLHALLNIKRNEDFFEEKNLLGGDLILVDESSMIELRMWSVLLASIKQGTHIIFMGDKDQLPPIESGNIFADLCHVKELPSVHLTKNMRTDREEILHSAALINEGNEEALKHIPIRPLLDPSLFIEKIIEKFENEQDLGKFCLLTPLRLGPFGVEEINKTIFYALMQKFRLKRFMPIPILITKNDYRLSLFNGEIGFLMKALNEDDRVGEQAIFGERSFPSSFLPPYEYAYALSIHKSQGSEYDDVTVLFPKGAEVFGREILYTAMTRAKKNIEIFGDYETVVACIKKHFPRYSGIRDRTYV